MTVRFDVVFEGERYRVEVQEDLQVRINDEEFVPRVRAAGGAYRVSIGRDRYRFRLDGRSLFLNGTPLDVAFQGYLPSTRLPPGVPGEEAVATSVRAPMPGRVIAVLVDEGAPVRMGTPLLILEAMKMQNEIPSPAEGEVQEVRVTPGDAVGKEQVLVVVR